jgi:hypothetical protein
MILDVHYVYVLPYIYLNYVHILNTNTHSAHIHTRYIYVFICINTYYTHQVFSSFRNTVLIRRVSICVSIWVSICESMCVHLYVHTRSLAPSEMSSQYGEGIVYCPLLIIWNSAALDSSDTRTQKKKSVP